MSHCLVYFSAISRCGYYVKLFSSYLRFNGVSLRLLLNMCHIFWEEQTPGRIIQLRYFQGEIDDPYTLRLYFCLEPKLFV